MRSTIVILLIVSLCSIHAYPDGAPKGACIHLMPKHEENVAQTKTSPFLISANSNAGSSMIDVTISSPNGEKFKGFLIQARSPAEVGNGMGKNLGQFSPSDGMSQTLKCNSTADAITHTNNDDKESITFQWSPGDYSGDVVFAGTIVQDFKTYFMGAKSAAVEAKGSRR